MTRDHTTEAWALYYYPSLSREYHGEHSDLVEFLVPTSAEVAWVFDGRKGKDRCLYCEARKITGDCPGIKTHAYSEHERLSRRMGWTLHIGQFDVPRELTHGELHIEIARQVNAENANTAQHDLS